MANKLIVYNGLFRKNRHKREYVHGRGFIIGKKGCGITDILNKIFQFGKIIFPHEKDISNVVKYTYQVGKNTKEIIEKIIKKPVAKNTKEIIEKIKTKPVDKLIDLLKQGSGFEYA